MSRTSNAANRRYKAKTYRQMAGLLPAGLAADFLAATAEAGVSVSTVFNVAAMEFVIAHEERKKLMQSQPQTLPTAQATVKTLTDCWRKYGEKLGRARNSSGADTIVRCADAAIKRAISMDSQAALYGDALAAAARVMAFTDDTPAAEMAALADEIRGQQWPMPLQDFQGMMADNLTPTKRGWARGAALSVRALVEGTNKDMKKAPQPCV